MNTTSVITILTPILAPLAVALAKTISARLPRWTLPLIAGLIGGLIDICAALLTSHEFSGANGVLLGLAGVGLRELVDQLRKTDFRSLNCFWMVLIATPLCLSGCARFSTVQTERRYDQGKLTAEITTRAASATFFEAKSSLAKWKATQTEKSQSAEVGGLSQDSSSTNLVNVLGHVEGIIKAVRP